MGANVTAVTAAGRVQGKDLGDAVVFYGVPYAAPPIGDLTFAAPVPPVPWNGVRDATVPGPTAQHRAFAAGTIPDPSVDGDDILTVNVWSPAVAQEARLPVLVWFHGGAFIAGSPVSPWYDGRSFARDGIVVVTVGSRLGIAGFGTLPDAPQNRAVRDWIAALEWVQQNIGDFGGDPSRVTIAGQSAGGGAVLTLLGTPRIGALVHGAIAMSPVAKIASLEEAARATAVAAERLGVEPTAAALSRLSRETLADVPWTMPNVFGTSEVQMSRLPAPAMLVPAVLASLPFTSVLDGEWVTAQAPDGARSGPGAAIPLMIGAVGQEFTGMAAGIPGASALTRQVLEGMGASGIADAYLAAHDALPESDSLGQLLSDVFIRSTVPRVAENRDRTWVYDFTWGSRGAIDPGRAFHCLDIPFAWNVVGTPEADRVTGTAPQALAAEMHAAWTSFITGGDPGWAPYRENGATRRWGDVSETIANGYAAERLLVASPD